MVVVSGILHVLLQIEHLEFTCLLVVEGHRVTTTAHGGVVVGLEAGLVGRFEEVGCACPVFLGIRTEIFLGASGQQNSSQQSGDTCVYHGFHIHYFVKWLIAFLVMISMFLWNFSA